MFPDRRVLKAVPSHGFLAEYVEYAVARNPAVPLIYHVGAAYGLLASLVQGDPRIGLPDIDRPTGLWIINVGRSGSGKTSAINIARDIYEEVVEATGTTKTGLTGIPGTPEGLYKTAADQQRLDDSDPNQRRHFASLVLWEDDLGKVLASSNRRQSYAGALRAALLNFYDGQRRREALATKTYEAPRNRTTILSGVTPAQLTRDTDASEWETGFFSRFLMLYHDGGMEPQMPAYDDDTLAKMRSRLVRIAARLHLSEPVQNARTGQVWPWRLTSMLRQSDAFTDPTAKALYEQQRDALVEYEQQAHRYAKGPIQRATDAAMRAAALIVLSEARDVIGPPGSWRFSEHAVRTGFALAWLHVKSAERLAQAVTASPFARLCAAVVEILGASPRPLTMGDILHDLARSEGRTKVRAVREVLDTLWQEGVVHSSDDAGIESIVNSGSATLYALHPFDSGE